MKGGYIKSGTHKQYYIKYIATRDGVQIIQAKNANKPATKKQNSLIEELLREFPDAVTLFEYEDYKENSNRLNASELITAIMDHNLEEVITKANYVDYIANRPRVEKLGRHGLFSDDDREIDLQEISRQIGAHSGNLWTTIVSLKREDATRLAYDNANSWKHLVRSERHALAKAMKIAPENLKWYAAFHNEGHHPHIHLVTYSNNPREGYVTKQGLKDMKRLFTKEVFHQDLLHIYKEQTDARDTLKVLSKEELEKSIQHLKNGNIENALLEQKLIELSEHLKEHKGRKVFKYLSRENKQIVHDIMLILQNQNEVKNIYETWLAKAEEIQISYKDLKNIHIREPMYKKKEFTSIKNEIINQAYVLLDNQTVTSTSKELENDLYWESLLIQVPLAEEDDGVELFNEELDVTFETTTLVQIQSNKDNEKKLGTSISYIANWSDRYKEAKKYLYGTSSTEKNIKLAVQILKELVMKNHILAMCDLATLYEKGIGVEEDRCKSNELYQQSKKGFEYLLPYQENKEYFHYRLGKFYYFGLGTEQDYTLAMKHYMESANNKYAQYSIGTMYHQGLGVEKNHDKATHYFYKSAKQDNAYAQFQYARLLISESDSAIELEKADVWLKKAYNNFILMENQSKDDNLQYKLGYMNFYGLGTEKNLSLAENYLAQSIEMKNKSARLLLAKVYLKIDVPEKIEMALKILEDLKAEDNMEAYVILGRVHFQNEKYLDCIEHLKKAKELGSETVDYLLAKAYLALDDITHAVKYLEISDGKENPYASQLLGKINFDNGELLLAEYYYRKAVALGNEFALYGLGRLLFDENNDESKRLEGFEYLSQLANQGNEFAQFIVGREYISGTLIKSDYTKAVMFLKQSAEQGNQYAQYTIGKLFLYNHSIYDREKAKYYLNLSAEQGNEFAGILLERMNSFLGVNPPPEPALLVSRLMNQISRVFTSEMLQDPKNPLKYVDRKVWQKIREKKMAQGQKMSR